MVSLFDVSTLGDADPEAGSPRENSKKQERERERLQRDHILSKYFERIFQVIFCNMLSMTSDGFGVVLQKSADVQQELRS